MNCIRLHQPVELEEWTLSSWFDVNPSTFHKNLHKERFFLHFIPNDLDLWPWDCSLDQGIIPSQIMYIWTFYFRIFAGSTLELGRECQNFWFLSGISTNTGPNVVQYTDFRWKSYSFVVYRHQRSHVFWLLSVCNDKYVTWRLVTSFISSLSSFSTKYRSSYCYRYDNMVTIVRTVLLVVTCTPA